MSLRVEGHQVGKESWPCFKMYSVSCISICCVFVLFRVSEKLVFLVAEF